MLFITKKVNGTRKQSLFIIFMFQDVSKQNDLISHSPLVVIFSPVPFCSLLDQWPTRFYFHSKVPGFWGLTNLSAFISLSTLSLLPFYPFFCPTSPLFHSLTHEHGVLTQACYT